MKTINIDKSLCTKCGICIRACSGHVYKAPEKNIPNINIDKCWSCGHCVAACPNGAIFHSDFPLDKCSIIDKEILPDYDSLVLAIKKRRAIRCFKNKAIPRNIIEELLELSRFSPTAHNAQNVDWLVIDSKKMINSMSERTASILCQTGKLLLNPIIRIYLRVTVGKEVVKFNKSLAKDLIDLPKKIKLGEDPIFYNAPVVIIAHVPSGSYFGRDDVIHALYNVELAADRAGLGTCQMGYLKIALDRDKNFKYALNLSENRSPEAALAIGFPEVDHIRMIPRRKPIIQWM